MERHGLLIIITLGESVMGLGLGLRGLPLHGARFADLLLGLHGSALLHLAVTAAVFVVITLIEDYTGPDRGANSSGDAATF